MCNLQVYTYISIALFIHKFQAPNLHIFIIHNQNVKVSHSYLLNLKFYFGFLSEECRILLQCLVNDIVQMLTNETLRSRIQMMYDIRSMIGVFNHKIHSIDRFRANTGKSVFLILHSEFLCIYYYTSNELFIMLFMHITSINSNVFLYGHYACYVHKNSILICMYLCIPICMIFRRTTCM